MSEPQNQNQEAPGVTDPIPGFEPVLPEFGPVTQPEKRHRTMPPIPLENDVFHVTPATAENPAAAGDQSGSSKVIAKRTFFSNTIFPSKDEIARRAFALYEEQGRQPGHDAEYWLKAEAQLNLARND